MPLPPLHGSVGSKRPEGVAEKVTACSRIKKHPRDAVSGGCGPSLEDTFEGERSERHIKPVMWSILGQKPGNLRLESATRPEEAHEQNVTTAAAIHRHHGTPRIPKPDSKMPSLPFHGRVPFQRPTQAVRDEFVHSLGA